MAAATLFLLLMFIPVVMSQENSFLLRRVINALENLVKYYKTNYRDLNIDGLFGLRVLEGHMELLLQEYSSGKHQNLSLDYVNRIKRMLTDATTVCKDAIQFVKRDDEEYYNTMSYVIGQPWNFLQKHKQVLPELRWHPSVYLQHKKKILDETTSDMCMAELTGGQSKEKCKISEQCIKIMSTKGLSGYGITHQILWTMLAEQAGCSRELEDLFRVYHFNSTDSVRLEFCTNNLIEMTDVVHGQYKGVVVPKIQDLFLEQEFICPSLGFYQFLSKRYLEDILSWQKPDGCFGHMHASSSKNHIKQFVGNHVSQGKINLKLTKKPNLINTQDHQAQNVAQMNINPKFNIKTMLQGDKHENKNNNIPLNKIKTLEIKHGALLGNMLEPVSVSLDRSTKLHRLPASNISLRQNANVVMQAGDSLVGNFQENNVPQKFEMNHEFKLTTSANNKFGRKLLHLSSIFDSGKKYSFNQHRFKSRHLQAEKHMRDGCLAHKTAVGAGALVMYLRYMIDPGPLNLGTDPEEFRQRFLMSHEFTNKMQVGDGSYLKKQGADDNLNINDVRKGKFGNQQERPKDGNLLNKIPVGGIAERKPGSRMGVPGVRAGAMDNNILAAQLHGNDHGNDNQYQDDGDYKEKGYENEMYPENQKDSVKHLQRLVQFDNNDGADKKKDDYDEDDYNDNQDENEENDNYEYRNNNVNNNHKVDGKHDKQPAVPKPDDKDYTYYDENHKHDDYNNENEEADTASKNAKVPPKESKNNLPKDENPDVVPHKLVQDHLDLELGHFENPHLPKALFVFILLCSFGLLIIMYRFIKNRRIHIRYHPRSFLR